MSTPGSPQSPPCSQHEPMAVVSGFVVVQPAQGSPLSGSAEMDLPRRATSLLRLHLSTSPVGSCEELEEEPGEDAELFSDDMEESSSPGAVCIVQRDDAYYKLMLRVRAVVNARLWSAEDAAEDARAHRQHQRQRQHQQQ